MSKVFRLTKRILPVLTDPAAIGRISDVSAIAGAGALARGVGALADLGVGILQTKINEQKAEQDALQALQDQTELIRRASDFQTQGFDVVQANREAFKSDPKKGVDELGSALRKLGEGFFKGLTPQNVARLKRTQEATIGRFELQERTNAVSQTRINIQNDINTTAQTYLESSNLAGIAGDIQRLETIVQDVSVLTERAAGVFESKSAATFSDNLENGIVENFTDAFMFHNTKDFLDRLNEGVFDDFLTEEQISEKKTEAGTLLKTQNAQAKFNLGMNFLRNNPDVAKLVDDGKIDFNQVDELVAAENTSPEYGEAMRQIIINGKAKIVTDPVIHGDFLSQIELLKTTEIEEEETGEIFKLVGTESLEEALVLQQKIVDATVAGKLKASDGNILIKTIQLGMSNTMAINGLTNLTAVNHYADAISAFKAQGQEGQDLLDAIRSYAVMTDVSDLDGLNDQLLEVRPPLFGIEGGKKLSEILPGTSKATAINLETEEDLRGSIERIAKVNRLRVLEDIVRKENPSLNVFQGDLPNNILKQGLVTKGLPGGDIRADVSVKIPEATNTFNTIEEMEAADLPSGTIVIIGGRKGRID